MSRMAVTAGRILASHPTDCDTILIADGRVEALTRRDQVGDTPTVDYGDAAIVPAFTDSHLHPLGYTALLSGTSLKEATSMAELGEILGAAARDPKTGEGLVAHRLDDASLGRLPDRHDLDQAVPSRPLLAYRYDGHVAVANSAALARPESTPPPPTRSAASSTATKRGGRPASSGRPPSRWWPGSSNRDSARHNRKPW